MRITTDLKGMAALVEESLAVLVLAPECEIAGVVGVIVFETSGPPTCRRGRTGDDTGGDGRSCGEESKEGL